MNNFETILCYIFWIIVIIVFYKLKTKKKKDQYYSKEQVYSKQQTENLIEEKLSQQEPTINTMAFSKKDYLLTPNELNFYKALKKITDKLNLNLFCQVSMYELVNCKDFKEFNRIKSKTIDFVVTEPNCKIKLCIELDDRTHNSEKRINRDIFVDTVFQATNTRLLRINSQNYYNSEKLEEYIKDNL